MTRGPVCRGSFLRVHCGRFPDLTLNVYGRWSAAAINAKAAKVEAEGFPV
jgi:hypothetical protein